MARTGRRVDPAGSGQGRGRRRGRKARTDVPAAKRGRSAQSQRAHKRAGPPSGGGRGSGGAGSSSGQSPTGPSPIGQSLRTIFRSYRILFVIYGVGLAAGLREFAIARSGDPVDWASDRWAEMTEVVREVNPGDPDTEFLEGVQSIVTGDAGGFVAHFEDALAAGVKHNEFLLRDYAQHLVATGADWRTVNEAVNRWRENHPFSNEVLTLELGTGPRTQGEISVVQRELRTVDWIAAAELEAHEDEGRRGWRVHITFRPPNPVDVREAVAAVSILSVPERDRTRLKVTCRTLTECGVELR